MDKILNLFLEDSEKQFYVRQIAKILKKSPTTISKSLKKLEKDEILKSEKKFNHLLFRGNLENRKFKNFKLNYNLNKLENSGLIEYLEKEFKNPKAIILFGSFSKAENISRSDIDLLIISLLKKDISLAKFEKILNNKIQLFVHSRQDIKKMSKTNKELLNKWINGITLRGFWEAFE